MKKKFAALTAAVMTFAVASVGSAYVDDSAIALGDIAPGSSLAAVKAKYPDMRQIDDDSFALANGFVIDVDEKNPDVIEEVKVYSSASGIETPAGIGVGSSAFALNDAYGKADKIEKDRYDTEYIYYNSTRTKKLEFKVIDGVIRKIICELRN